MDDEFGEQIWKKHLKSKYTVLICNSPGLQQNLDIFVRPKSKPTELYN